MGSSNGSQIFQQVFEGLKNALLSMCTSLRELFFQGFGDANNSFARDYVLPAQPYDWTLVANIPNPSILYVRNMSDTVELMFHWNNKDIIGGRVAKTEKFILDKVVGLVYAKSVTTAVTINILVIPLKLSE